jgi:hypothetical protein
MMATDFRAGFVTIFVLPVRLHSKDRFSPAQALMAKYAGPLARTVGCVRLRPT